MIKSFEKKYPNVKISQASQGGYSELLSKIQDNIKAGTGPVIAQTYPDHVVSYLVSKGAVVDLNKYAYDPELGFDVQGIDETKYVKSFWEESFKYDKNDSMYSLPFNKSTEIIYYNQTIFSKYDWFVKELGYKAEDVYSTYNAENPTQNVYRDDFLWHPTWQEIEKIGAAFKLTSEYKAFNDKKESASAFGYDSQANLFITLTQQFAH